MTNLLEVSGLSVHFPQARSLADMLSRRRARSVRAVEQVGLSIKAGDTLGLVGESGCGKTTLGRAVLGLTARTSGSIRFDGKSLDDHLTTDPLAFRRGAQMVFQDPFAALNPKMPVGAILGEVLHVHRMCDPQAIPMRVAELLETVGLAADLAARRPRALSGGQCQRVGIARALAVEPKMIVADEAVSALDVSVQAQILNLLSALQRQRGLTVLFVSHDLSVVRHVCRRIAVMYLGRIVETGLTEEVFARPQHPYTVALLNAKPRLGGPRLADANLLAGEPPSPMDLNPGCAFSPRCAQVMPVCKLDPHPPTHRSDASDVACHLYDRSKPSAEPLVEVSASSP